ncbi:hypothetical protein [Flavobacterium pectinovorum]|uniref:hypothetical protein n=1 Tax=Flavobacterium pectinovorum TaxID=29533 RepID=UPI001FAC9310|nr:hypothetical protein [Flavobacterium pectinovorum]MCI9844854.1 hypothetical protein [Flavobacterium pectinovorum]
MNNKLHLSAILILFSQFFYSQVGIISNINENMGYFNSDKLSKIKTNVEYSLDFNIKDLTVKILTEEQINYKFLEYDFANIEKLNDLRSIDKNVIETISKFCNENSIQDLLIFRKITHYDAFYATDLFFNTEHNFSIFTINSYNANKGFFFSNFRIYHFNNLTKEFILPTIKSKIKLNTLQLEKFENPVYDLESKKIINEKVSEYYINEFQNSITDALKSFKLK